VTILVKTEVLHYSVSDGVTVVAEVGGDPSAPPVILMHGGGQTRHSWGGAMQKLLRQGYHVINLDARGHGDSDWSPTADYSLDALSRDLRTVAESLSRPPALVGASLGGATALYASGNFEGVRPLASMLVMVDVVPRPAPHGAAKIGAFMRARPDGFASLEEAADAVAAYYPNRRRPKDVSGLMKNLRLRADRRLHWHWDPQFVKPSRPDMDEFAELLLKAARRMTVPTLLVRGLQSDIVSDAGIAEFREALPALEVLHVSGAGHMVAGDKNDAFNEGVIAFLERHRLSDNTREIHV
jgi:pimeloyl-ACP methyl ester carboxylesterase